MKILTTRKGNIKWEVHNHIDTTTYNPDCFTCNPSLMSKKQQQWNCRAGINGWHEVGCPHLEKNKKSNNLLEVRLQEETDRLNHAFNKCLENVAKIGNCNQPITITCDDTVFIKPTPPQGDWEKEFDEKLKKELPALDNLLETTQIFGMPIGIKVKEWLKDFISTQIQQAYKEGYNACLKDFKIPNKYGEKSL